jgi:uncharacterized protein (TIGR03546 family)
MLTLLAKILGALNSDAEPIHIALAIAFAMLMGFNPTFGLIFFIGLFFVFALRVHFPTFLALYAVFATLAVILGPVLSLVGSVLLESSELQSMWIELYQTYWFRIFELNNSLVLGGAVVSIISFIPLMLVGRVLVIKYREVFMAYVNKFKIVQSLKASKFYRIYESVQQV